MSKLGGGKDITGCRVLYFGMEWVVTGKNYLGDWTVERIDYIEGHKIRSRTSISSEVLPPDHAHFAIILEGK